MHRDMDLARALLIKIADDPNLNGRSRYLVYADTYPVDGYSYEQIDYHIRLLIDGGLLDGEPMASPGYVIGGPTWAGHEFIDNTRDPTTWEKLKGYAATVGSAGMGVLGELAKAELKAKILGIS